jgi:hypothetical protein
MGQEGSKQGAPAPVAGAGAVAPVAPVAPVAGAGAGAGAGAAAGARGAVVRAASAAREKAAAVAAAAARALEAAAARANTVLPAPAAVAAAAVPAAAETVLPAAAETVLPVAIVAPKPELADKVGNLIRAAQALPPKTGGGKKRKHTKKRKSTKRKHTKKRHRMVKDNKDKSCPICSSKMSVSARYPNMICHECSEKTLNEKGEPISFYNKDHTGGFYSLVDKEKGNVHDCFVEGHKCYADEARFGGIVIQLSQ